jgi:hypothetical protein
MQQGDPTQTIQKNCTLLITLEWQQKYEDK